MGVKTKRAVRQLLIFVFMLGLFVLGWGPDDLGSFFAHPARTGYVLLLFLGSVLLIISPADVDAFRKGKQTLGQRWFAAWSVAGMILVVFLAFGDRRGLLTFDDTEALRYAGLALCLMGGTLRLVAFRQLGKQFSAYVTLQEEHQLVQSGIYGVIRHPMYLGYLLAFPGMVLVFRSWLVVPAFVGGLAFILARIRPEEKLLHEHFGSEFDAYRQRTWRLLPYLY